MVIMSHVSLETCDGIEGHLVLDAFCWRGSTWGRLMVMAVYKQLATGENEKNCTFDLQTRDRGWIWALPNVGVLMCP